MTYWYGGQPSEMPASVRIERNSAFTALDEFMRTGTRPQSVTWEET